MGKPKNLWDVKKGLNLRIWMQSKEVRLKNIIIRVSVKVYSIL